MAVFREEHRVAAIIDFVLSVLHKATGNTMEGMHADTRFDEIGLDSLAILNFNSLIQPSVPQLSKTLLFDCRCPRDVAMHLLEQHAEAVERIQGTHAPERPPVTAVENDWPVLPLLEADVAPAERDIAIVGLHGRYPGADDPDALWRNLLAGTDAISEIPDSRWPLEGFYAAATEARDSGLSYAKWGGFLDGIERFDAQFFGIPPREAACLDPQERLFMECAWHTLEASGYAGERGQLLRQANGALDIGVFVGITSNTFPLLGPALWQAGNTAIPTGMPWSVANRVSYTLNLCGPSLAIDTACSSSLTALHMAMASLRNGECKAALVGGVNLYTHPAKYVQLCQQRMLSPTGRCHAFGQAADGFVPGEGVGAILLKPLQDARRDGDRILAVIKGSAINHGARSNGYTVPSAASQAALISRALQDAQVSPGSIGYIEAHGTGTRLGDPIEVEGLRQALGQDGTAAPCHIGSIKSNIGHLEAAAGLASLSKVILQLQQRRLAPSLHADTPNPDLALDGTRLRIVRETQPWTSPDGPLRAGISSFGAGGANAHVILEEAPALTEPKASPGIGVFVLSARSQAQLREQARQLLDLLQQHPQIDWRGLAYTLQCCRQAFEHRLALVADEPATLLRGLDDYLAGTANEGLHADRVIAPGGTPTTSLPDEAAQTLARHWVKGMFSDWSRFWPQPPRPAAAPLYPFERERHWPATPAKATVPAAPSGHLAWAVPGDAFYLRDHIIQGTPVLPAAAYMDFFRTQAERHALRLPLQFGNLTWASPITQRAAESLDIAGHCTIDAGVLSIDLRATPEAASSFRGECRPLDQGTPRHLDLRHLREACRQALDTQALYRDLERLGIDYGPSFRCLEAAWLGQEQALTQVTCRLAQRAEAAVSALDPALLDAVLQSAFVTSAAHDRANGLTFIPYACKALRLHAALGTELFVHVQARASGPSSRVFDFTVADGDGRVLVEIEGFAFRVYQSPSAMAVQLLEPHWRDLPREAAHHDATGTTLLVGADTALAYPEGTWRVLPGERFHYRDGQTLEADLGDPRHTELLLRLLQAQGLAPRAIIFDLHALLEIETADWRHALGLGKALQVSQMLRNLCRAIAPPKLHVYVLTPPGPAVSLAALLRSVVQEIPALSATLVETDATTERPALLAELGRWVQPGMRHLRLSAGHWQEHGLRFAETPTSAVTPLTGGLEAGDVLLLSGGLGAIGRVLSKTLAEAGGLHLALLGRSVLTEEDSAWLRELERLGAASARYWPVDCADSASLGAVLDDIRQRCGPLKAVLHCAGALQDGYFTRQENADWDAILRTKALSASTLDRLTAKDDLKLFMTCSSLAGIHGNVGQGAYALANAWLDQFIAQRARQVEYGERRGHSLSIAWPLWQTERGMQAPAPVRQWLAEKGLGLLPEDQGAATFLRTLAMPQPLLVPVYGRREAVAGLFGIEAGTRSGDGEQPLVAAPRDATQSLPYLLDYLARQLSEVTATALEKIDPDTSLEVFGLDSILVMELNARLEKTFPAIPKTLLFEVRSLSELAAMLQADYPHDASRLAPAATAQAETAPPVPQDAPPATSALPAPSDASTVDNQDEGIAIIGLAGHYPGARDPQALWQHLAAGHDLVSEGQRWEQPNGSDALYARWGGFIEDFDCFDPLFFGISPRDAERMDPQERLFLQAAWHCVEDAGYTPQSLSGSRRNPEERRRVSVIAGVMYGEYQFYGATSWPQRPEILTNSSYASIANRVSYCLDFDGPSFAIDSMCSSSLTSLHLACDLIRSGTCDLALAGGVNLSQHPYKYRTLCELGFASSQGQCRSFGEGGDGYVPGEGVGVTLLKPLSQARRDGDHIYGVIRGSDLNHGGRTSGYTVPNADAQSQVIARALHKSGLPAHRIGYIEAHGTGTSLGDPIEIRGLSKALGQSVEADWRCPIGSIKSNIGHLESAAGIAALTKVLLQLQHQQLAPSLHAQPLNPNIDFDKSRFTVQQTLDAWPARLDEQRQPLPRVAAISSFGAGGANAHLIIEEHPLPTRVAAPTGLQPFVFSARSGAQLQAYLQRFVAFLENEHGQSSPDATHHLGRAGFTTLDVAHTLLAGRLRCEEARLVVLAEDFDSLRQQLGKWLLENRPQPGQFLHHGQAGDPLHALARRWLEGEDIALPVPAQHALRKVPLPGYEFLRRRYWIKEAARPVAAPAETITPAPERPQEPVVERPSPQSILERVARKEMSMEQARELLQGMI